MTPKLELTIVIWFINLLEQNPILQRDNNINTHIKKKKGQNTLVEDISHLPAYQEEINFSPSCWLTKMWHFFPVKSLTCLQSRNDN